MQISLTGKTAVVTGGAHGIGRAMARCLASCGANVFVFDIDAPSSLDFPAQHIPCDVTSRNSLNVAFNSSGPPDILLINAGTGIVKPLAETTRDVWDKTISLNLTAAFETLQEGAARMKANKKAGAIVLTASTNSYDGEENLIAYNATKAGVLGLLHTAANELGPYGIRVNAVNPGLIRTRLTQAAFDSEPVIKDYFRAIPMGRGGEPEEVAKAAVFLASDWASYITGATLLVDGGQMCCKFGPWKDNEAEFANSQWRRLTEAN
ncbi:MAG: SDR family oxidoreductase [Acidobacteria bacterium]|nr:SDR family oxidoreductase [Acidobacteriota bacterium]